MGIYKQWKDFIDNQKDYQYIQEYYLKEAGCYKNILAEKTELVEGTVEELAVKMNLSLIETAGFISGIETSLKNKIDLEGLEADSTVRLEIDFEKLLWHMYDAKAPWLYDLEEWDKIFDEDKRKEIKKSWLQTVVAKREKPGRNDPCLCGSGKKYKKCCGMNKNE